MTTAAPARPELPEADPGKAPRPSSRRRTTWLFLLFLGLAVVLRFPTLTNRVFNSDEAYLATQAQVVNHGGALYVDTVDRKPPIAPYIYALAFRVTGSDDLWSPRALAMLAHAITALLLAAEARRRFRARHVDLFVGVVYLLAATALSPSDAQAANFEIYMLPLMTAAMLLGIRRKPAAAGITASLATLTKQTAAITLLPLAWLAWSTTGESEHGVRRIRGLALLGAGFGLPLLLAGALFGFHDFFFWTFTSNGGYLNAGGAAGYVAWLGFKQTGWFLFGHMAIVLLLPFAWKHRRADRDLWLWTLSAVIAACTGLRFFGHYYLQLVPPLCLLAGRGFVSVPFLARRWPFAALCALTVAPSLYFIVPAFTPQHSSDAAVARHVADYVRAHTEPGDRILVWGHSPEVYWASGRLPATRFATTGFLTGQSGGRPPSHNGEELAVPGAWDDFLADLRAHPPALIVDMSQADQRNASYYRPEDFAQFRRYLFGGSWREVAAVDKAGIYVPLEG